MTFLYIILAGSKEKDESSDNVKENQSDNNTEDVHHDPEQTDNQSVDNTIIKRKRQKSQEPDDDGNENPRDDAEITSMSCYYFKL